MCKMKGQSLSGEHMHQHRQIWRKAASVRGGAFPRFGKGQGCFSECRKRSNSSPVVWTTATRGARVGAGGGGRRAGVSSEAASKLQRQSWAVASVVSPQQVTSLTVWWQHPGPCTIFPHGTPAMRPAHRNMLSMVATAFIVYSVT